MHAPSGEIGLFEALYSMKAMRRLRPDPVPRELIARVIEAGTLAPSGGNRQPWAFLVVQDPEAKRFIQERYRRAFFAAYGEAMAGVEDPRLPAGTRRMLRSAVHLAEHLHEAPVHLLCCVEKYLPDHPTRPGQPQYASIFPAVQNILLACRGLGLGATLTTLHTAAEAEIHTRLGIPDSVASPALIPIGYPLGRWGRPERRPAGEVTSWERWGNRGAGG